MGIGVRYAWEIDIGITPGESRGNDANNVVNLVIKFQRFPDAVTAAAKLTLPEQIAENRDRCRVAIGCIAGIEFGAEDWGNAHIFENVRRVDTHVDGNGNLGAGQVLCPVLLYKHVIYRGDLPKLLVARARNEEEGATVGFIAQLDVDHAVVILIRIWVHENAVDHAEDGSGCADAEHQRDNAGDHEAG